MSNLEYPISVLMAAATKLTLRHPTSPEEMSDNVAKLDAVNKAITILRNEKKKDEIEERKKKL